MSTRPGGDLRQALVRAPGLCADLAGAAIYQLLDNRPVRVIVVPILRLAVTAGLAVAALAIGSPVASAAQVVTWTAPSKFVDPAGPTPFNRPPGVPPRPNALRVNVYLPDGYDGHHRFPVLWLLHGHGDAYDSWVNPKQGDFLRIAKGFRAIVVMPEGAQGWYTDWWNGGRRTPGWESYYLLELMPLIERRLRIMPGRANHAIAGLSMGGEGTAFFAELQGFFPFGDGTTQTDINLGLRFFIPGK